MEIAHSGRFFAAAVAEPSLPAFGLILWAHAPKGCFIGLGSLYGMAICEWSLRHAEHLYVATPPA